MKRIFIPLGLLVATVIGPSRLRAVSVADFSDFSLRSGLNQVLFPGRLHTPPDAQLRGTAPRPLIINLTGGGGSGTDTSIQLGFITDDLMAQAQERVAFIYAPHDQLLPCPTPIERREI